MRSRPSARGLRDALAEDVRFEDKAGFALWWFGRVPPPAAAGAAPSDPMIVKLTPAPNPQFYRTDPMKNKRPNVALI